MFTVNRRTDSPIDDYPILQRVGFTWHTLLPRYRWALTSPFHPYRKRAGLLSSRSKPKLSLLRRFISVALSLKSPSPDVIRHPVLCCSDFPHSLFRLRDRITNSNQTYYTTFLEKMHLFFLLFYIKKSKIKLILNYIMGESCRFFRKSGILTFL